jgi:VanZ family protein
MAAAPRDRSAALPLLAAWVALIVYASLYPFAGWRWPPGAAIAELLRLPWPRYLIGFDIASNLLGYLPLGFLVFVARWRQGGTARVGVGVALVFGALLSWVMEVTQQLLPQRVPSLLDAALNAAGATLGALLAAACAALGWLSRWQRERDRWFDRGSAGATALLLLWPAALLFPAPVPLGLGQVGTPLRQALATWLADADALQPLVDWLARPALPAPRLPAALEALTTALGLFAPCLIGYAATRPQRRRTVVALAATAIAIAVTALSTALNFGPEHAFAWVTPAAAAALAAAMLLALAAHRLAPRRAGALAVAVLVGLVVLVHVAPADPYYAQSLHGWEQGRFVRFHGVAQWVGWLWPYAALAWVLARLGATTGGKGFP